MTHGDMEENVSGCFFLNTVYIPSCPQQRPRSLQQSLRSRGHNSTHCRT